MSDLSQTDTAAILWWRNHILGCFLSNPENYPSVYKLLSVQLSTENIYYIKYVTSSSINTLWLVISFNQTYVCKTKALVSGSQPFWLAVIRLQLLIYCYILLKLLTLTKLLRFIRLISIILETSKNCNNSTTQQIYLVCSQRGPNIVNYCIKLFTLGI